MAELPRAIQPRRMTRQGIAVDIAYEPNWFNSAGVVGTSARLTVTTGGRYPLPFTETGYRSVSVAPEAADATGGPAAYVTVWLDQAEESPQWQAQRAAGQQRTLFWLAGDATSRLR